MNIGTNAMPKTYKSWANGYKALIDTSFKKGKDYTSGVFFKDSTENWEDRIVEIGGIDDFSKWEDGERATQTSIEEGFAKQFVQVPFGKEVPIGRLLKKFQGKDVNLVQRASRAIGARAYRMTQEAPYSLLNYAFSNTNTYLTGINGSTVSALLPDGKRLASTLHPCSPTNSATWSNTLSASNVVGEEALKLMIENLDGQLDDKGEKKHYGQSGQGFVWLNGISTLPEALRVVGSELRSGTGNNDKNVYKGEFNGVPIEVKYVPWLDVTSTAHMLMDKSVVEEEMPLVMLSSVDFYTDDYIDEATMTVYVRGQLVYAVGAVSGRGIVLSDGTTVTYSA